MNFKYSQERERETYIQKYLSLQRIISNWDFLSNQQNIYFLKNKNQKTINKMRMFNNRVSSPRVHLHWLKSLNTKFQGYNNARSCLDCKNPRRKLMWITLNIILFTVDRENWKILLKTAEENVPRVIGTSVDRVHSNRTRR